MSPLAQAIDVLVKFVERLEETNTDLLGKGELREQFDKFDRAVYVQACLLGLDGKLPEKLAPQTYDNPLTCLGMTNLPGCWGVSSFSAIGWRAWRDTLFAIGALADAMQEPNSSNLKRAAKQGGNNRIPAEGEQFDEKDVPAEFRDGGKPSGVPLTAPYLEENKIDWDLKGSHLRKNYGPRKTLTTHIRIGRRKAYLFTEVAALRTRKTQNQAEREDL
jgi:hypothetical protein